MNVGRQESLEEDEGVGALPRFGGGPSDRMPPRSSLSMPSLAPLTVPGGMAPGASPFPPVGTNSGRERRIAAAPSSSFINQRLPPIDPCSSPVSFNASYSDYPGTPNSLQSPLALASPRGDASPVAHGNIFGGRPKSAARPLSATPLGGKAAATVVSVLTGGFGGTHGGGGSQRRAASTLRVSSTTGEDIPTQLPSPPPVSPSFDPRTASSPLPGLRFGSLSGDALPVRAGSGAMTTTPAPAPNGLSGDGIDASKNTGTTSPSAVSPSGAATSPSAAAPNTAASPAAADSAPPVITAAAVAAAAAQVAAGSKASVLLAVCPGIPSAMRRPTWCLADYQLGARLYKGEVSSVYKAVCIHSGLKVVLKVYSLQRVADNTLHTLVREVRIHSDLAHANVLMLYGVFEEDNRLVLVLERASRGDLFRVHRALPGCRMSEDQLRVLVLAPLLEALAYLHARGLCHRDIKPENLLLTTTWQLRLADFGAAINLNEERAVTRTGTVDYMAPEVERCPLKALPQDNKDDPSLAYSTAADMWSVGILAYEMLIGFPPFVLGNESGNLLNTSGDWQPPVPGVGDGKELRFPGFVSAGAQDFIATALAERPGDRPTAAQMQRHPWLKHAVRQHRIRQQKQSEEGGPVAPIDAVTAQARRMAAVAGGRQAASRSNLSTVSTAASTGP
ncbi:hypothetical protein HYH03_018813 [Edaphochlamys debaryana]|uniref:Protein kinase domain-containing protein n=1 Tax=Edaphochlamys debaryana TaxID=47281 RepID=A0A835XFA7_9CHLO|nr:hypothetical protein HYH03_018813 [Edaphochlamys debaryana]|eukprot:KAG2482250.1 hypothetical protein HYH03_018813 [Edaphochlamys debaryana]